MRSLVNMRGELDRPLGRQVHLKRLPLNLNFRNFWLSLCRRSLFSLSISTEVIPQHVYLISVPLPFSLSGLCYPWTKNHFFHRGCMGQRGFAHIFSCCYSFAYCHVCSCGGGKKRRISPFCEFISVSYVLG